MKRIAIIHFLLLSSAAMFAQPVLSQEQEVKDSFDLLSPVEVKAIRAGVNAPFTKTNLTKRDISKLNLGQDVPFLLNQTPSVVINSDAGNGVGYTGIRIRGTDPTRINVTLNGIPYNDAESQITYFVDLPDFSSSVGSIQIQRGVGTSSNGAGAFGASINFSTNEVNKEGYGEFNNSFGSFNTWKNTVKVGSGLIADHFLIDARLSRISSDGYIDRAKTDLKSFYFSTAYLANKSSVRVNIFSGKEKTYQAWNGVSETDLKNGNRTANSAGTEKTGDPYNNETDNFQQDHFQLFFDHRFKDNLVFNTAFFLTKGKGYYEQYKAGEDYADYGLNDPSPGVSSTDLVRQLWLENNFYGNIFSLQLKHKLSQFTLGGGWTRFDNNHYGDIIWAQNGLPAPTVRWYDFDAKKTDLNVYFKQQTQFVPNWFLFYDLQYRHISYDIGGFRDHPSVTINSDFDFFNPKAGISYAKNGWKGYLSYSIAGKEPNRDDFEAGIERQPKREKLGDIEMGIERNLKQSSWSATLYYMHYKDQLVLTGEINDVGAYTRTNIPKSYRMGVELQGAAKLSSWMSVSANLALSKNKVQDFTEFIDDYDMGGQKTNQYEEADIAFSPNIVGGATISFLPVNNFELALLSKYVGKQFLDNTQNESRKLNAFYTQDARLIYTLKNIPLGIGKLKEVNIIGQVNNIFNKKYEPNGYTFSYIAGGETITENFYFPMAGTNFMIGVNVRL
jgi:iron complex outermembrane receptor protein